MARSLTRLFVAAMLLLTSTSAASADPISWQLRGAVTQVLFGNGEISDAFPIGDEAIFNVTIDPAAGQPCGPAGCFDYQWADVSEFTFDATIAGNKYYLPNQDGAFSNERVTVNPANGMLVFDNSLGERLSGDTVGTAAAFRPRALDFSVRFPGVTFDSYAIPSMLPAGPIDGAFSLYLSTCRDLSDPQCVPQFAQVQGSLTSAIGIDEPMTIATLTLGLVALAALVAVRRTTPRLN